MGLYINMPVLPGDNECPQQKPKTKRLLHNDWTTFPIYSFSLPIPPFIVTSELSYGLQLLGSNCQIWLDWIRLTWLDVEGSILSLPIPLHLNTSICSPSSATTMKSRVIRQWQWCNYSRRSCAVSVGYLKGFIPWISNNRQSSLLNILSLFCRVG